MEGFKVEGSISNRVEVIKDNKIIEGGLEGGDELLNNALIAIVVLFPMWA